MRYIQVISMLIALTIFLGGCVTSSTSTLTKKADPEAAVQRYVQLGLEYIKLNDMHRARIHLTRALSIDPEDASANAAFGLISQHEGDTATAEKSFLKAIVTDKKYTRGRTYYAAFLFSEGRFKEALHHFEISSNDNGYIGRSQIFMNIALCHVQLGDNDAALIAYQKTLRLDRTNTIALSEITELLILENDFKRAQKYYNHLVRLIRQNGLQHSAQSLWQGIRIAEYFKSHAQAASLVMLLKANFPDSNEYSQYLKREQARNTDD
jgi:type IV pilus assembly protein PilF